VESFLGQHFASSEELLKEECCFFGKARALTQEDHPVSNEIFVYRTNVLHTSPKAAKLVSRNT
jgi:hypothetical protein